MGDNQCLTGCTAHSGLATRITELDRRVTNVEANTEATIRLAMAVEQQSAELKNILEQLTDHEQRIGCVERQPGTFAITAWRLVTLTLLTATISAVVGAWIRTVMG